MNIAQALMFSRWLLATIIATAMLLTGSNAFAGAPAEIDVTTAAAQVQEKQIRVLDVREPAEFATGVIQGAMLMPLGQVERRVAELDGFKDQPLYVVCGSGGRSARAIKVLSKYGFTQLTNIKGGMDAWRKANFPVVAP
jgi:rhodanese-related sulfurtransferase